MEKLNYIMNNYDIEILISILGLILLLFLIVIIQGIKISKTRRLYKKMFRDTDGKNIEEMLINNKKYIDSIIKQNNSINSEISNLRNNLKHTFSKTEIFRYDAFSSIAGQLSFVYVLLNQQNSGVILNGIYSNEGHYLYLKNVVEGKTENELSKEEKSTLQKALEK